MDRFQAEYGLEAILNSERERGTMRGFKIAQRKLGQKIWRALEQVTELEAKRAKIPRRVPVQSLCPEPVVKLAPEREHLTNVLKRGAYQAESALFRAVSPHYRRAQGEGRTLIQSALASAADLDVTQEELRVTLAPLIKLAAPDTRHCRAVRGTQPDPHRFPWLLAAHALRCPG